MKKNLEFLSFISLITQIGIVMALPIIGCILIGNFLDNRLNSGGLFLVIFSVLGVGAAFRNLFIITAKGTKSGKKRKDGKNE
ncbi:AtpZ/AtpI family protein [Defluviitalea phaphyphila]|uniref:AtpZ/AtpI family protein n=1 Tax=Defluviitalea phaphyphila TaxID=1473580 RepID=UPI0007306D63|nr:AtpZ/AtpI family protein [Defluviitalea phaphyphila]